VHSSDSISTYGIFILGMFFVLLGVAGICTGDAWSRFGVIIGRRDDPKKFWGVVVGHFICGACLLGYFLYLL
jgi:hypothetical protein